MKILLFHTNSNANEKKWHIERSRIWTDYGYDTEVITTPIEIKFDYFNILNKRYLNNEKSLFNFYKLLLDKINKVDLFIHFGGAMIHPDIVQKIDKKVIKVYHCADDPESSDILSKPVSKYYDYCAISNIAEINNYIKWGCKNVFFWPLGAVSFNENFYNHNTFINYNERKINICYVGAKYGTPKYHPFGKIFGLYNKKSSMNKLIETFKGNFIGYGSGWENGYINENDISNLYNNTKIGINIHNSTGPINSRLYDLNAYGVLQICDNKKNLSKIYELDKEIIGFDKIEEAIDKIKYFLNHPLEAAEIALNGKSRFEKNYNSLEILKILLTQIGLLKKFE